MGDNVRPDKAMGAELLLEIQKRCEAKLLKCKTNEAALAVCLNAAFLGEFQGKEIPMMSPDAVAKHLACDPLQTRNCLAQ